MTKHEQRMSNNEEKSKWYLPQQSTSKQWITVSYSRPKLTLIAETLPANISLRKWCFDTPKINPNEPNWKQQHKMRVWRTFTFLFSLESGRISAFWTTTMWGFTFHEWLSEESSPVKKVPRSVFLTGIHLRESSISLHDACLAVSSELISSIFILFLIKEDANQSTNQWYWWYLNYYNGRQRLIFEHLAS